jgi:GT2 family glycosyltransferase
MTTICLLTHNRADQLEKTLRNIDNEFGDNLNILVLNNGSSDGTRDLLDEKYSSKSYYKLFHSQDNLGVARGREFLWRKVSTKYILSIDDDIIFTKSTVEIMISKLEENKKAGLISPDIKDSFSGKVINGKRKPSDRLPSFYEACFLLRKDVVNQIGYFDSKLTVAGEGLDYALRLRNAGYSILRTHEVSVVHVDRVRIAEELMVRRQQWLWSFAYVYWKNLPPHYALFFTFRILLAHIRVGFVLFGMSFIMSLPKFAVAGSMTGYTSKSNLASQTLHEA